MYVNFLSKLFSSFGESNTKHTFLFKEAVWKANGRYCDEDGEIVDVKGKFVISLQPEVWQIECLMGLSSKPESKFRTIEYKNSYEIKPFGKGKDFTYWVSLHSALGKMDGQFVIVDDTILAPFKTRSGTMRGTEFFRKINNFQYENKGTLLERNRKTSSWSLTLTRSPDLTPARKTSS